MSQQNNNPVDAAQHVPDDTGAALAAARSQRQRREGGGSASAISGAPPSNTAPCNYNPESYKALRYGVDSLYVSYPGVIAEEWDRKLANLKELAQSEEEHSQALAQVVIGEHIFEVKDKGRGRFSYVLVDNCYQIQASNGRSKALPMAYVQISSEYLAAVSVEQAEASLRFIVNTLGLVTEPANISRVDLFVDFVAELKMDAFDPLVHWISRTQSVDMHYRYNQFSGWSFGMGGGIGARLYNKRLEIEKKSHKFYLYPLWLDAGWDVNTQVWRMEFEAKRDVLKELGIFKLDHLLQLQTALWLYLTQDWLRLAVPSLEDSNTTRWPNHPLWDQIIATFEQEAMQPKLKRFSTARLPSDDRLFLHGLGGLTSFMAREGIEDMSEGIGEYFHRAQEFHNERLGVQGSGMGVYIERKVNSKNRRYNTVNNRKNHQGDNQEIADKADTYRKASDGE